MFNFTVLCSIKFNCCGVKNYEDWFMIEAWPNEKWVPNSCCKADVEFSNLITQYCGRTGKPEQWYDRGCSELVHMWFYERLHIIGILGLVVAFIQVRVKY